MGDSFARAAAAAAHIAQALGWTPDIFWAATPADLRLALGPPPETPGNGDVLRRLMEAFPDG